MKLYIVRHGQTIVNVEKRINGLNDDDLNETGIEQAKQTREFFENIDYDLIISSTLKRAKHTAELLNVKNKTIIEDERIRERDAGQLTKALISDLDTDDWWSINPKNDYKDAETVKHVIDRVYSFIDEIKTKYNDKNIVIVTHGGISKVFSSYFLGVPENGTIQSYRHKNCEIKEFEI